MANTQMGLIGRKLGMTQIFDEAGNVAGVTVIEVAPNTVLQVKTSETKDGYAALQLAIVARKAQRATKAELGHFKAAGVEGALKFVREVRVGPDVAKTHQKGAQIAVGTVFAGGEKVDVTATSKGRGFAGVMKRHNFAGFKRSHGVHEYYRHGGSIGTRLTPGMTLKGVKMPGHMGSAKVTVQNLKVVKLDADRGLLYVRGGVPGAPGALVTVRKAVKGTKKARK
ncbi:MAG: 50S ribosomal protein L3 [Myxococcota bacterium]